MNICKDCKYYGGDAKPDNGEVKYFTKYFTTATIPCLRIPLKMATNLVSGEISLQETLRCETERYPSAFSLRDPTSKHCGPNGRYFVSRFNIDDKDIEDGDISYLEMKVIEAEELLDKRNKQLSVLKDAKLIKTILNKQTER